MGPQSHRKISTGCVILVLMCTFGFLAISANAAAAAATTATTKTPQTASVESVEEVDGERIKLDLDLEKAESKDAQKVEIIKQIQKVNNDGSYTVGYEAEDGTFKIESRDVLGNVKGTFGYVDANGEIKRVSYTANNGTGLKSVPIPESTEDVIAIPRYNRSAGVPTTRRPTSYSSSSQATPTRSTVIQTIPRRLRVLSSSSASSTERANIREFSASSLVSSSTTKSPKNDPTTTIVYATSVPTSKTYVNIRPTPLPGSNLRPAEQIARPEKLEINHVSKVQISSNRDTSISKPVVEEVDEKDEEDHKSIRGNTLRRQLMPELENKYEPRQPLLYSQSAGDEAAHVYGPVSGTQRPLFTTSTTPRIPALVLAARQRAANIQSAITSSTTGPEKYYIRPLRKDDENDNDATTESTSEHQYLTQSPIPVQIPANRYIHNSGEEEKRIVRRPEQVPDGRFRSPQFVQRLQPSNSPRLIRIPIPTQAKQQIDENEQYLRETSSPKNEQGEEQDPIPIPVRPQPFYRPQNPQYVVYSQQEGMGGGYLPQSTYPGQYHQPQTPPPLQLRPSPVGGGYYQDYVDRPPLTARDFERLLQALIYRYQRLNRPYNIGGIGYSPYHVEPYQIPPRVPFYNPYYRSPVPIYPEPENMYQAQNPIPTSEPPMPYELQRLMPRKKQYNPRYFGAQTATYNVDDYSSSTPTGHTGVYLPPDVREELLYRMLMLALQADHHAALGSSPVVSTTEPDSEVSTTTKTPTTYKKPVRSVQILGEEQ